MFAANIQPIASSYLTQFHLLAAEAWHVQQKCIKQRGINLWGLEKSFSNEIPLFYVNKINFDVCRKRISLEDNCRFKTWDIFEGW